MTSANPSDTESSRNNSGLTKFAWFCVAYNLLVIVWGAYVRATASGAGCGNDWPVCKGGITPAVGDTHQLIEYTHRASTGLLVVLAIVLFVWVWRKTAHGAWTRYAAAATLFFLLTEIMFGALLVLGSFVTTDTSGIRAVVLGWHFTNTLFLLASMTLTAYWSGKNEAYGKIKLDLRAVWLPLTLLGLAGITGAMAALGDTLFPPTSLDSAVQQDFLPGAHFLVRWRWLHPVTAITAAVLIMVFLRRARSGGKLDPWMPKAGHALVGTQLIVGAVNVLWLAPLTLQMLHLVLADAIWVVMVVCSARMAVQHTESHDH